MEITILGTGSIYSKSTCASLIIDKKILVDVGPGVVKQLLKKDYNLTEIETILITHLHSDHILDFPTLIVNEEVLQLNHKINIYAPKGAKKTLLRLLKSVYGNYFNKFVKQYLNFIDLKEKDYEINNYKIKAIEVIHTGIKAFGFIIDSNLGITGDASICKGVETIFNSTNTIVSDCSMIVGDKYHMGIDNNIELLKYNQKKKAIFTHLRNETKEELKKMNLKNGFIVEDGFTFYLK